MWVHVKLHVQVQVCVLVQAHVYECDRNQMRRAKYVSLIRIIFKTLLFQDFFKAYSELIQTYCSQRSNYRQKAAAVLFLVLVQKTPASSLRGCAGTARSLPAQISPLFNSYRSPCCRIWWIGRLADCLDTFTAIKIPEWDAGRVSLSFHKNWPWDNKMRLFGWKIGWDTARAFVMCAAFSVTAIMTSAILFVVIFCL